VNIGIYLYDQAEILDFAGPFEVFATATRICEDRAPFNPFLIGATRDAVTARAGFRVVPAFGFDNHPAIDVLIVPGGVHIAEMGKPHVIDWIRKQAQKASLVASVCTGAFLLAQAKVLEKHKATTHWEDIADLRRMFPHLDVVADVRWVDEGRVVTSGGISAGIDMSLYLVGRLHSRTLAHRTARQMAFSWTATP